MSDRPLGLTKRQYECLQLAAEHRTSKEIAVHLGLSPHTVDGHIEAARIAMKAPDRATAARKLSAYLSEGPRFPTPELLTGEPPPVEQTSDLEASGSGQNVGSAVPQGRRIELGLAARSGIILLVAAASVYAIVLLLVGADVIARRPWSASASATVNR